MIYYMAYDRAKKSLIIGVIKGVTTEGHVWMA